MKTQVIEMKFLAKKLIEGRLSWETLCDIPISKRGIVNYDKDGYTLRLNMNKYKTQRPDGSTVTIEDIRRRMRPGETCDIVHTRTVNHLGDLTGK